MNKISLSLIMGILMGVVAICDGLDGLKGNWINSIGFLLVWAYCIRSCSNASNLGEVAVWAKKHSSQVYFLLFAYIAVAGYLAFAIKQGILGLPDATATYIHAVFFFTACIVFRCWVREKTNRS